MQFTSTLSIATLAFVASLVPAHAQDPAGDPKKPLVGEAKPTQMSPAKSGKTRAEVAAETAAASKAGKAATSGEGGPRTSAGKPTQKTREEVKAETAAARKPGKMAPAGEAASK
jgi:hypothetical protein